MIHLSPRGAVNGAGCSATGRTLAAGEVVKEWPAELPRVKFLDRCLRVSQRAAGDAHEVDRSVQVMTVGRAADNRTALDLFTAFSGAPQATGYPVLVGLILCELTPQWAGRKRLVVLPCRPCNST